ncbi:MAG: 16S rRNA (cytosine(1402)-N(4))-methyltransferase RsmH [Candidatus Saccharimonadales bacterium]
MTDKHIPVLVEEVIAYLDPHAGEHYLDLTAGYGGHARRVLERLSDNGKAILVDRDENATTHLTAMFADDQRVKIRHNDFYAASQQLYDEGVRFDLILADIGLSSPHLDNASRGFSFQNDGPLDMRMDPRTTLTASDLINTWSKEDLVSILQKYGEIRGANRIVDAIIEARPIATTTELAGIINKSTPRYPKVRLEARIFQALRIAVNAELDQLSKSLPLWHQLLKPGGRLAVISFHSLEDRLVKRYFNEHGGNRYDADLRLLTKQPVTCTPQESSSNPRARSAKLRALQRK